MKSNNSNKRISNIIAGILLVFIALVFIATALGVVGYHLNIQDKIDPLKSGSKYNLEGKDFVSIAQYDYGIQQYNTEPGTISQVQEDLCVDFEFPLCINPCEQNMESLLNVWYKVYEVYGGYEPDPCGPQQWNLYQWDKDANCGQGGWVIVGTDGTIIGWSLTWVEITDTTLNSHFDPDYDPETQENGPHEGFEISFTASESCCYSYWVCIIDTSCGNCGCIDSNKDVYGNIIPGKQLELDVIHGWTGCGDESQAFVYILVQISRIPNSRINI